jgi:hypothetical protein
VETVELKVEDQGDTADTPSRCAEATALATKVVDRLP